MSDPQRTGARRGPAFLLGFLAVCLLVAGGLSYLASGDPDGLDSVTLEGCEVVEAGGQETLEGTCIAQNADDHALGGSPLADYTVGGADGSVGLAGVIGVVATLAVAGGLFWVLRRRGPAAREHERENAA
ncbi:MAG TPA: PDGLE domain-containing protein [Pseudonocardia sp.]|nr:PDGLE domain-containing protein [Pseudonocardia sp.]